MSISVCCKYKTSLRLYEASFGKTEEGDHPIDKAPAIQFNGPVMPNKNLLGVIGEENRGKRDK